MYRLNTPQVSRSTVSRSTPAAPRRRSPLGILLLAGALTAALLLPTLSASAQIDSPATPTEIADATEANAVNPIVGDIEIDDVEATLNNEADNPDDEPTADETVDFEGALGANPNADPGLEFGPEGSETVAVESALGTDPGPTAASETELAKMRLYLANLYANMRTKATFMSRDGLSVACVDPLTQPAFRNPLLKQHKLQTTPPTKGLPGAPRLATTTSADQSKLETKSAYNGVLDGSLDPAGRKRTCPAGSVPIVVKTLQQLARFDSLAAYLRKSPKGGDDVEPGRQTISYTGLDESGTGSDAAAAVTAIAEPLRVLFHTGPTSLHQYAKVDGPVDNWGGEAYLNLWSPYVERNNEFSLSQLWVVRGSGSDKQTVETGWQVYNDKYGDNSAHLFTFYTADGYGDTGCYNDDCGAWVQYSNSIFPEASWTSYSTSGGTQYRIKLLWVRDPANGNWWLRYEDTWVGYYPHELFDAAGLANKAARVSFGGEIVDRQTSGRHTKTDIGSGAFPGGGFGQTTYTRSMRMVDLTYTYARFPSLTEFRSDAACYDVDKLSSNGSWGDYFYMGGEGYNLNTCR